MKITLKELKVLLVCSILLTAVYLPIFLYKADQEPTWYSERETYEEEK